MIADGAPGYTQYPFEVMGHALHDMAIAGTPITAKVLAAFCRDLVTPKATPNGKHPDDERTRIREGVERMARERAERLARHG